MQKRTLQPIIRNTMLALLLMAAVASTVQAQNQIDCSRLPGTGSFSNPLRIGRVSRTTIVVGCPGLSSGRAFNHRYYTFDLTRQAPANAVIGTMFIPTTAVPSAVHPRLALPNGTTLMTSMSHGFWYQSGPWVFRLLPFQGFRAGRYVFGVEKLDSPLRSLRTPSFNLLIVLP
jgi:hypothetical protein